MHCNLRPPEPHQPFHDTMPRLKSYRIKAFFAADTLVHAVTLTFDLWPWTSAMYRLWRDETLYQIWTQSSNPRRSYCDFSVWPYDLEHCVAYYARLWDNFHHVWHSTTYPCLNHSVFMRWPWSLTRWPWKFVGHQASRDQGLYEIRTKSSNPHLNYL